MFPKTLDRIERGNVALGLAAVAVCGLLAGPRAAASAAVGAALATVNFRILLRLGSRALLAGSARAATTGALLTLKVVGLFVVIAVAHRLLGLEGLPLAVGLTVVALSCLVVGLTTALAESRA